MAEEAIAIIASVNIVQCWVHDGKVSDPHDIANRHGRPALDSTASKPALSGMIGAENRAVFLIADEENGDRPGQSLR